MQLSIIHTYYVKIAIISLVLLGIIQGGNFYLQQSKHEIYAENTNATTYKSANSNEHALIGVALSTRIGIAYQDGISSNRSGGFYGEIASIGESQEEKKAIRSELIAQNMLIIQEYLNLSRTDIKALLGSSNNRESTLEGFISQLEMRYTNSALSVTSLEKQKSKLLEYLDQIQADIENVKVSMENNFSAALASDTLNDVDIYIDLRSKYTQTFTDIVFINQFIKQHNFLNNYNKGILDTLINNKEAIINQSYVVIPDSGDQYLRPLELIFDEEEIKNQ